MTNKRTKRPVKNPKRLPFKEWRRKYRAFLKRFELKRSGRSRSACRRYKDK